MITLKKTTFLVVSLTLLLALFSSCSSDDDTVVPAPSTAAAAYEGAFVSAVHPTSGTASVNNSKSMLTFTNFMSDNGPDLDIYLVSNLSNVTGDFINLGDIKGLSGTSSYDLPANVDLSVYKYVVVWCSDFNVNFGYATLAKQ